MDFTLLEPSRDGTETVLIVADVFSKFALAFPTKNQRASTVAKILMEEMKYSIGLGAQREFIVIRGEVL